MHEKNPEKNQEINEGQTHQDSIDDTQTSKENQKNDSINSSSENQSKTNETNQSSLGKRWITACVLIALLAIVLMLDNHLMIWGVLGIFFVAGIGESLRFFDIKPKLWIYLLAVLIWIGAFFNNTPILSGLFIALALASFIAYKRTIPIKSIFPFIYPTLPFLAIYSLYTTKGALGDSCLIWLITIAAITDTGAYFGGRTFGRTPLSPTSPKKTLEGTGVGVALGIIVGSIVGIGPADGFVSSLLISILVSVACVFGDLFESYLKREAGLKDSGTILPGHGGVLDRFDGILFGAVTMYFLLEFLPMWKQL